MKPLRFFRFAPSKIAVAFFCGLSMLAFAQAPPAVPPVVPAIEGKDHGPKMAKGIEVFKKHVRPVLVSNCLRCHGGDKTEGELEIIDRAQLVKGGVAGAAVIPGDPDKSLLYRMITHQKKPFMPYKEPKLSDELVGHFRTWIELGAPYDKPLVSGAAASSWTEKKVDPLARQHWAFQPLTRPAIPKVRSAVSNPVDAFIVAGLEAKNLAPGKPATELQMLRRAHFNLVGLPPTPAQVEAFEKDSSSEAFARVVDNLLASERYGERWARHWLDLARFGESHGFEHDYDRPTAYPYRDFVIKALNDDLPWTDFVRWQLAGDEIAPDNIEALKATGFLSAGVHSTQITKNEAEKHRYDEMDDMLATTTTSMLGLTVGCARCHDHKFDPFPQADYYRMLSTFTTTIRADVDREIHRDKYLVAKAAFDATRAPLVEARRKYEAETLPKAFAAWEAARKAVPIPPTGWLIPEIVSMKSVGGATMTKQDDGSVRIAGKNPTIETLVFELASDLETIRGIRLEALADAGLVGNGPGRATNGNFALTDFRATIDGAPMRLKNPKATFDQKGLGIAGAIDGDTIGSAWAIDPQFGKTHAASFELDNPVSGSKRHAIHVELTFHMNVGHGMGRPRISLSSTIPGLTEPAIDGKFATLLSKPAAQRSAVEAATLHGWYAPTDVGWKTLTAAIDANLAKMPKPQTIKMMISSEGIPAIRLHTQGDDFLAATHFLRRGDSTQKEGEAKPGYLQVVTRSDSDIWKKTPPVGSKLSYRRTALADWMIDTDKGAGHLLARVAVNRVWQHHFGRGLVESASDFGSRGDKPSHPELLDYLAGELIRNGWKLKPIHKLILTSQAFGQTSDADAARVAADRPNALVGRYPVRRLEGEVIRDAILSASGQLDETMYGPGTLDENSRRRSVYFTIKRSKLIPMLAIFDAPDGTVGVGDRGATTIAPQALHLMNHPSMRTAARSLASIASAARTDSPEIVRTMYRRVISRPPTADELKDGLEFIAAQEAGYAGKGDAKLLALTDLAQVIFCLNETIYID